MVPVHRVDAETDSVEAAAALHSVSVSPEQAAEESELRSAIRNALGSLEPKHRAAVVLRYYQGFSEAETAVALGCRPGTVKSRVHYALRRLRQVFATLSPPLTAGMAAQPMSTRPSETGDRLSWAGEPNPGEERR
ncbi:MAG: sigma-70 family RNA polymerase sigma factor [Armatimonadetes bacterium]|nr:sigma-70 family RNA polymerase sigma factor [Armatimonadota bacterium]